MNIEINGVALTENECYIHTDLPIFNENDDSIIPIFVKCELLLSYHFDTLTSPVYIVPDINSHFS